MVPARQRLETGDLIGLKIVNRLVVDLEFASQQRRAQIELQQSPSLGPGIHSRLEETVGAPAIRFGPVKRHVRILQQLIGVASIVGRHGNPDASADNHLVPLDDVRSVHNLDKAARKCRGVLRFAAYLYNGKLVTPQSGDGVAFAYALAQAAGHFFQKIIADRVAKGIIDVFEVVEIEAENGDTLVARYAAEGVL
jgi:hypothetical protein